MDKQSIIDAFLKTIHLKHRAFHDWYIGISHDPKKSLSEGHGVDLEKGLWASEKTDNPDEAWEIEAFFLNLGVNRSQDGHDPSATEVYICLKRSTTKP